ncbi:hypothetical protein L7F22_038136 [Adiantum nelumboides]|nr:hypothetical protein [Adiantum nelumboides]
MDNDKGDDEDDDDGNQDQAKGTTRQDLGPNNDDDQDEPSSGPRPSSGGLPQNLQTLLIPNQCHLHQHLKEEAKKKWVQLVIWSWEKMVDKSLSPNYLLGLAPFFPSVYAGENDMRFNYAAINDAAGAVVPAYHCPQYEGQHTADSSSNFMNKMLEQHDEFLRMEEQQCKMGCDHDDDQRPADLQSNHKPNEKLTSLLQDSVDNSINDQLQLHADSDYTDTFQKRKLPHNKYCTSSREVEIADTEQTSDGEVGSHAVLYSLPKGGKQLAAYANFLAEERHWTVAIAGADDQEDDDVDNEYIAVQDREEKAMQMDTGSWSLESMMGSSSPDQVISTPPTASSLRSEAVEAANANRAMKAAELRNASMKQDKGARTSPAVNKEASNVQSKPWRRASLMEYMRPAQIHKHLQLLNPNYLQGPDNNTRNRIADGHLCSVCEREPTDGQIILCRPCFLSAWRQNKDIVDVGTSGSLRLRIPPRSIPTSSYLKTCKLPNEDSLYELAEEWVQCDHCDKWQHHICVLFNPYLNKHNIKYYCPMCSLKKRSKELHGESTAIRNDINLGAAQWRARSLPSTSLSDHIESRLYSQLQKERAEREAYQGFAVSSQEVESLKGLVVRVVATTDKVLSLNPRIFEVIRTQMDVQNWPSIPYRSKMVMLFQDIGGVDVCLFVMYVQEYGSNECQGHRNHKFVYIAYLDSVKYFEPANARTVHNEALWTFVYHQILIGYLEKFKLRGFNACYIWSSPPKKGDSYILNCHPSSQLIPQPQKLCKWYMSMAEKAKREGVVSRYMSLFEHFFGRGLAGPNILELPSFDGDFVPHSVVGIIAGHYSNCNRTIRIDELMAEVHNYDQPPSTDVDPDPIMRGGPFDDREEFLGLCQQNKYQFDTLRRAKHSSMMILYYLHRQQSRVAESKNLEALNDRRVTSLLQGSVDNGINDQLQLHAGTYDSYIVGDQALLHVPLKVEPMATLIQSPVDKSTSSYTDSDYTATFQKRKLPHNKYCTSSREVKIADTEQTSNGEVGSHAVLYSLPKRGKQLAAYANFLAEERHWTVAIAGADDQEDDDVDNEYIAVQHREEIAMQMDTGSWSLESMMGSSSPDQVISTPPTASSGLRSEAVEAANADRAMKAAELRNASMKQDKGARTSPAVSKEASNVQSKLWRRASLMDYLRPAQIHKHLQLLNPNYLQGPDNNTRNRIADGHLCSVCERGILHFSPTPMFCNQCWGQVHLDRRL